MAMNWARFAEFGVLRRDFQIGLVDQSRRLERVPGPFAAQKMPGEPP